MVGREQLRSWVSQAHLAVILPASLVAVLVLSVLNQSPGGHTLPATSARTAAVLLLAGVTEAALQMGHRWRAFARHDSIRADIAAAGGLGKRLMV